MPDDERQHIESLLSLYRTNLRRLEKQAAIYGAAEVPIDVQNKIAAEQRRIVITQELLSTLDPQPLFSLSATDVPEVPANQSSKPQTNEIQALDFKANPKQQSTRLFAMGGFLLLSFIFLSSAVQNPTPQLVLLGLGALGAAGVFAFQAYRFVGLRVRLLARALVCEYAGQSTTIPLDAISEVYINNTKHTRISNLDTSQVTWIDRTYTIVWKDDEQVVFGERLDDVERLGEAIIERVHERLFLQAVRRYRAGEAVSFGPVSISKKGFEIGGQMLSWRQVVGLSLDPYKALRQTYGEKFKITVLVDGATPNLPIIPVAQVPNYAVLKEMVDRIIGDRRLV